MTYKLMTMPMVRQRKRSKALHMTLNESTTNPKPNKLRIAGRYKFASIRSRSGMRTVFELPTCIGTFMGTNGMDNSILGVTVSFTELVWMPRNSPSHTQPHSPRRPATHTAACRLINRTRPMGSESSNSKVPRLISPLTTSDPRAMDHTSTHKINTGSSKVIAMLPA